MSDDHSARLALPYLAAGQMQKHVTLNEALTRLDALVQTAVVSRTTTVEPGAPVDGALWILPANATGADWSARSAGTLLRAERGGWTVVEAGDGLIALVLDADELVVRQGGVWVELGARLGVAQTLARLGVGTTADAANPFAARLNAALWTALEAGAGGTGDLRMTLNKETAGDVLSLLFQSGYGGRAELGLVGDDDLRLKVSGDGTGWSEAFAVERATGRTTFALGAGRRTVTVFDASGTYDVPAWARSVEAVLVGGGGGGGAGGFGASGSRFGGGGGGAGGISRGEWPADLLGGTLTVVVGTGGAGGDAAAGSDGNDSLLFTGGTALLTATGGGAGGLGGAADGAGGSAGTPKSNAGGASSVSAAGAPGESFDRPDGPGGGGAGGGLDDAGVARSGGAGGDGGVLAVKAPGGPGGTGGAGSTGAVAPRPALHWAGGGGGGGGAATSGAGFPGGVGGWVGGGGGGGGAGVSAGGTGAPGGAGIVWLVAVG